MPRTKKPPLHLDEISSCFGARFAAAPGEAGGSSPRFESLPCSVLAWDFVLVSLIERTMEGNGRSGRDAGKEDLRLSVSGVGRDSGELDLGLRGDGRKVPDEEATSEGVEDMESVLDIIDTYLASMVRVEVCADVVMSVEVQVEVRESLKEKKMS